MLAHRNTPSSAWKRPTSDEREPYRYRTETPREKDAAAANSTGLAENWTSLSISSAQGVESARKTCCDCASRPPSTKRNIPATSQIQPVTESLSRRQPPSDSDTTALVADFENCRQSLKITFTRCRGRNFSYACFAISCVLNSQRRLHTTELSTAVMLLFEQYNILGTKTTIKETERNCWLEDCAAILSEDSSGLVDFTANAMPAFVSAFRIRGIDVSHRTIALACLVQHELSRDVHYETYETNRAGPMFSDYAAKYWRFHCEKAEQSGLRVRSKPLGSRVVAKHTDKHYSAPQMDGSEAAGSCPNNDRLGIDDEWVIL